LGNYPNHSGSFPEDLGDYPDDWGDWQNYATAFKIPAAASGGNIPRNGNPKLPKWNIL
jgi:hypothetical protein